MSRLRRLCVNHFVSNTSKLSLSAWALSIARWPCIHIPRQTTLDDVSFVITFPKKTKSKSPKDRNASQKSKIWLFNLFKIWCNSDTEYTGDNLAGGFQKCSEHPAAFKKFQIIRSQCDKSSQFLWNMHITVLSGWALSGHSQDGLCAIRLTPSPKFFLSNVFKCMFVQRGSVICHLTPPKKQRPEKHQNTSKIPSMNHQIQRRVAFKMAKIDTNTYAMKAKAARLEMVPEFFEDEDGRRFEGQSFHVFSKRWFWMILVHKTSIKQHLRPRKASWRCARGDWATAKLVQLLVNQPAGGPGVELGSFMRLEIPAPPVPC